MNDSTKRMVYPALASAALMLALNSCITPTPGPGPVPPIVIPPAPAPTPGPTPKVTDFRVLILHETLYDYKLSLEQGAILISSTLRAYLDSVGAQYRIWDDDTVPKSTQDKAFQPLLDKHVADDTPWLVISSPKGEWNGPLPPNVEQVRAKVGEYVP